MSITREQVETLNRLYERRAELQRARERADRNFWIGVANEVFGGTGTRSSVLNAIGGTGEFSALMAQALAERVEQMQRNIDAEIEQNGGTP